MNISLPESPKDFVDDQVGARGYDNSSEYVRELIRKEQDRQNLRGLLLEGAASPPAGVADADYFGRLRSRVRESEGRSGPGPAVADIGRTCSGHGERNRRGGTERQRQQHPENR